VLGEAGAGRLVAPDDARALATAVAELLARPQERAAMAARGLERAAAYDWQASVGRLEGLYARVLATPGPVA
jgi:glycosyltransferase involved in cell wall biosynthesis